MCYVRNSGSFDVSLKCYVFRIRICWRLMSSKCKLKAGSMLQMVFSDCIQKRIKWANQLTYWSWTVNILLLHVVVCVPLFCFPQSLVWELRLDHKHSAWTHTHTHISDNRLKGDVKSRTSLEIKHLGTGITERKSQALQTVNKYDWDKEKTVHVLFLHDEILTTFFRDNSNFEQKWVHWNFISYWTMCRATHSFLHTNNTKMEHKG